MRSLYVQGSVKMAGPLTDNAGGAVVLEAATESVAKAIVTEDPAIKLGVFVYEMHPWELKLGGENATRPKGSAEQGATPGR